MANEVKPALTGPNGERLERTGENRLPVPGEFYIGRDGEVVQCMAVYGDAPNNWREILRELPSETPSPCLCLKRESDLGGICPKCGGTIAPGAVVVKETPAPAISKGYTNRHNKPVSDCCGEGRHAECVETWHTCNCTWRGDHKTAHRYMTAMTALNPAFSPSATEAGSLTSEPAPHLCSPEAAEDESADFWSGCKCSVCGRPEASYKHNTESSPFAHEFNPAESSPQAAWVSCPECHYPNFSVGEGIAHCGSFYCQYKGPIGEFITPIPVVSPLREGRRDAEVDQVDWDTVHALLEPWQKVWSGDKAKYADKYPDWMVDAAAELFAHDMCDAWGWDTYVSAATVIISRHFSKFSLSFQIPGGDPAKCNKRTAFHLIAGASWYACVLNEGHAGNCKPGGSCVAHGPYVCDGYPIQCPKWPACVEDQLKSGAASPVSGEKARPDNCECGHPWHGSEGCLWTAVEEGDELHCECAMAHVVYDADYFAEREKI